MPTQLEVDEVPSPSSLDLVRQTLSLGKIALKPDLPLATGEEKSIIWAPYREAVVQVVKVDVFGHAVVAFCVDHESAVSALAKWPESAQRMESMRYWVHNCAKCEQVPQAWVAISSEIPEAWRHLPPFHEALEDAIALNGVTEDGKDVPNEGRCRFATKAEITFAQETLPSNQLAPYLRMRAHMFENAGESHEFCGSLTLLREVLGILAPKA